MKPKLLERNTKNKYREKLPPSKPFCVQAAAVVLRFYFAIAFENAKYETLNKREICAFHLNRRPSESIAKHCMTKKSHIKSTIFKTVQLGESFQQNFLCSKYSVDS